MENYSLLQRYLIERMKKNIIELGEKKVFSIIDNLASARTRMAYRKYYLIALKELKKNDY